MTASSALAARSNNESGIGTMWRNRRVLGASLVGTAVEFYDFYIYGTAASLVFGPLFFPASSPTAQLLAASPCEEKLPAGKAARKLCVVATCTVPALPLRVSRMRQGVTGV